MLEIHVDVGRFVALARYEALEQQRHPCRVHLGDAEAEAHGGVGGGTAALAEDAAPPREIHDVVDREEIRLVAEFLDQCEFVLDECAGGRGRALRPAPPLALPRELPEPARGRFTIGHDLPWILVAQFVQREAAAPGDVDRRGQQARWIDLLEARRRTQVSLAIRMQRKARAVDGGTESRCREHVLQCAAAAHVHVHVAGSHQRQAEFPTQLPE